MYRNAPVELYDTIIITGLYDNRPGLQLYKRLYLILLAGKLLTTTRISCIHPHGR